MNTPSAVSVEGNSCRKVSVDFRLAGVVFLVVLAPIFSNPAGKTAQKRDFREVIRKAREEVFPSVVFIKCVTESHESGEKSQRELTGSGVIISPEGHVLTNWHVTEKAVKIRCQLLDGRAMTARLLGSDQDVDLALLKLEPSEDGPDLPHAQLGDSDELEEGDFVMAMGAPWGMSRSVSMGIISCSERYLPGNSQYSLWLQTDASISPGNSGGPLVNTEGEVVGITSRGIMRGGDLGFAIPSKTVKALIPQFREEGMVRWSWTGLKLQPLHDFDRDTYFEGDRGVIVSDVEANSPAQTAGIKPEDRLLSLNGKPLNAKYEEKLPQVRRKLALLPNKKPVTLTLRRDGKKKTVTLVPREKGQVEGEELECPRWDLTVKAINQFSEPQLFFYRKKGVYVLGTKRPGNAANSGLAKRDILLQIGEQQIRSLEDVKQAYKKAMGDVENRPRVVVKVMRNGTPRQFVLEFGRDYSEE